MQHELAQTPAGGFALIPPMGALAHDVRQYVSVMLGNIDIIRKEHELDDNLSERLNLIERAAKNCDNHCREIIQQSSPRTHDLNSVLTNIVCEQSANLEKHSIKLIYEPCAGDSSVRIVLSELEQIILNLITNAIEAMSVGGTIRLTTTCFYQPDRDNSTSCWVRFSINDDGAGISRENIHKIFQPHFSTKKNGSGFGLAVVQQLTIKNGGRIEISSHPGCGTEIQITLPGAHSAS